jgi:hypothetical protein
MSLEKQVVIDKIEVLENGVVQVRETTRILEDGNQLSTLYNRWTLNPGSDLTDQDPRVVAIANVAWTPEVIASFQEQLEKNNI